MFIFSLLLRPLPRYAITRYLMTRDLWDGFIPFPYLAHTSSNLAHPAELAELAKFAELTQLLALLSRISGQFGANDTKNLAKTKTPKAAFRSRLSASRSIGYEEDASEKRRSARTKNDQKRSCETVKALSAGP
jgi:hypothetical protein